ncbi:penicillin-binding protein 2 [Candidatus Gracilibacteria bacterium]|nr:penicillin-binding protein 2 [Candidatus Gracilibacteria bacterium]
MIVFSMPFVLIWNFLKKYFRWEINSINIFRSVFSVLFLIIALRFADLQVLSNGKFFNNTSEGVNTFSQIIPSSRGQILINDYSKNSLVQVTNTQSLSNVFVEPSALKSYLETSEESLGEVAQRLAGGLNLDYRQVEDFLTKEVTAEIPKDYTILERYIDNDQKDAINYLKFPSQSPIFEDEELPAYSSWLGYENLEIRSYPERNLLSNTLGFVIRHKESRENAKNSGCSKLVSMNEERGTVDTFIPGDYSKGQYTLGYYGIEQKYCTELAGLNGKKVFNDEAGTVVEDNSEVQNGVNVELTIDINLQRKTEEILKEVFKSNTNSVGTPKHGSALVIEVKSGKILAMASYPDFDPNEYNEVKNSEAFRNSVTSIDYEVGSVIKPLTVAAAVNEWQLEKTDNEGNRLGISPDWTFEDYDEKGMPYEELNGNILYIQNAEGKSYKNDGPQPVSNILRDSINTGIATIIPTIGNERLKNYFLDNFKINKPTAVSLPGDIHGDTRPLTDPNNLNSKFIYATFGFGQGYTMSPIQLARAYTPLANQGYMIEPYLVNSLQNEFGEVIDDGSKSDSPIYKGKQEKVLEQNTARLVTGYLANTIDQGYLGASPSKGQVPGYIVSGKTGTAQVGRETERCKGGNRYECNTNNGIYDHTFIGYGPEKNPQYLVVLKLAEPSPGVIKNFAENSLGPSWSKLMQYTLEYNEVPKDR